MEYGPTEEVGCKLIMIWHRDEVGATAITNNSKQVLVF
jgi:hypothetical protein